MVTPFYPVFGPMTPVMDITEVVSMNIAIFLGMMLHSLVDKHMW
jgi:hypothetical protein